LAARDRRGSARPLLRVGLLFGLGAGVGAEVDPLGVTAWLALLGLCAGLLGVLLLFPRTRLARVGIGAAALALGVVGIGVERLAYERSPLRVWVRGWVENGGPAVQLTGTLAADPDDSSGRWVLLVDTESVRSGETVRPLKGRVRLLVDGQAARPTLIEGDRVEVWARLGLPRGYGNPGSFDSAGHAFRRGVHAVGSCKSPALLVRTASGHAGWMRDRIAHWRQAAREQLAGWIRPGPSAGIVRAMVLGDRAGLTPETEEAFRIAGTYHVLALSGAQVALVAGLLLWPLKRLGVAPLPTAVAAGAGILFYTAFVGGDLPVLRAAVMAVVLLVGLAFDLQADPANLLGFAALVLLAHRPSSVADVSFQLSFVTTLAIIALYPVLGPLVRRLPRSVGLLLATSLAAQIGATPFLALHFNRLAPAALVLNLAAVPLASVVLIAGFGVALSGPWAPPLAYVAAFVAERSAALMLWTGELARGVPWADLRVPTPGAGVLLLYLAATTALARAARLRAGPALVLAASLVGLVFGFRADTSDGRLSLSVLDVGDGDSLVLRSPSGRVLLIDAGGARWPSFDAGQAVTAPFVWNAVVRRVDGLVLTHLHSDHIVGAPFVIGALRPREVWIRPACDGAGLPAGVADSLRRSGLTPRVACRGVRREWDGVEIEVLWPPNEKAAPARTENDESVVLAVRYGRVAFLLSGDAGTAVEAELSSGQVDVVKVPHHGSLTGSSEAFVARVRPRVAIVSCGRRREGEPALDGVLARYRRVGARVYRTDLDGAVTASTDGTRLWVETYRQHDEAWPGG
jgi:competence protein ComEC